MEEEPVTFEEVMLTHMLKLLREKDKEAIAIRYLSNQYNTYYHDRPDDTYYNNGIEWLYGSENLIEEAD